MRTDAIELEESRIEKYGAVDEYAEYHFHERHRVFPAVFENRQHKRILDVAAGAGCIAQRIRDGYPAELVCNDISPTSQRILAGLGLPMASFDLDNEAEPFPFPDGRFDAVIATVTIEHIVAVDHFVTEIRRVLADGGYLYISAPNYAGLLYLWRFLGTGRTFHDPLAGPVSRYEFYGHVRYFTYRTLLEFISSFGFVPEAVYLAAPRGSSRYQAMHARSKLKALAYRHAIKLIYRLFSPRWAAEPIICFRKGSGPPNGKLRKVVL